MQNDIYFGVFFTSNSILIRNVLITIILFVYDVAENVRNGLLQLKCKKILHSSHFSGRTGRTILSIL